MSIPKLLWALPLTLLAVMALPVGSGAAPDDPWPYVWPVNAPVIDGFRAPANPYAPGNRGLEFRTVPGQSVVAAREGTVSFAAPVAGRRFVTIVHADGVRTSYGALHAIGVRRGQRVSTGEQIGTAGERLHVGARIGDAYVDPAILFGGAPGPPRLVPLPRRSARLFF